MNKLFFIFLFPIFITSNAGAEEKVDQSLLIGDWCYKSITSKGSAKPKPVNTNWTFFEDGKVEVQSEWMRANKSMLPYEVTKGQIKIPKMNKKYIVSKLTNREMVLINAHGKSQNMFERGKCE